MPEGLPKHLAEHAFKIAELARSYGLDFYDTIFQVLEHDDERQEIAAAGQRRTLAEHTYEQRMRELVEILSRHLD